MNRNAAVAAENEAILDSKLISMTECISLGAVLVAIFLPWIHSRLFKPKLTLSLRRPMGMLYTDEAGTHKRLYSLVVANAARVSNAENVLVYLEQVDEQQPDKEWKRVFFEGRMPLLWQYAEQEEYLRGPRRVGPEQFCAIGRVRKNGSFTLLTAIKTSSLTRDYPQCVLRLWVRAIGDRTVSPLYHVEVHYDGKWNDDENLMEQHLRVTEPKVSRQKIVGRN